MIQAVKLSEQRLPPALRPLARSQMRDVPATGGFERVTAQSCRTGTAQMLTKYAIHTLASWPPSSSMAVDPSSPGSPREAVERQGCGERKQVAVAAGSQNRPFLDSYQEVNCEFLDSSAYRGSAAYLVEGAIFVVVTPGQGDSEPLSFRHVVSSATIRSLRGVFETETRRCQTDITASFYSLF